MLARGVVDAPSPAKRLETAVQNAEGVAADSQPKATSLGAGGMVIKRRSAASDRIQNQRVELVVLRSHFFPLCCKSWSAWELMPSMVPGFLPVFATVRLMCN